MSASTPYISFVVTARNDDHGGNLLHRMGIFVRALLDQAKRHNLAAELILVEWNPPQNRPRLREILPWPKEKGPCSVRVIEVSPDIHARFQHSDRLPLFQMIAKNVGIRRARGRFVLATNVDILLSEEFMEFLASRQLSTKFMYRIDRYDAPANIPANIPVEDQLEYCRDNVIRINRRDGTFPREALSNIWLWKMKTRATRILRRISGRIPRPLQTRITKWAATARHRLSEITRTSRRVGRRIRAVRPKWRLIAKSAFAGVAAIQIFLGVMPFTAESAGLALRMWVFSAIRSVRMWVFSAIRSFQISIFHYSMISSNLPIFLSARLYGFSNACVAGLNIVKNLFFPQYPRLHTNGCGDFTLMAREHWNALRGYPELEIFSFNLDSVLLHMAYQHGLREKVLRDPMRIYHIEHSSGWTPEGERRMTERLQAMRIPMLDFSQFQLWAAQMQRDKRPMILAGEDWGMASYSLHETVVESAMTVPLCCDS